MKKKMGRPRLSEDSAKDVLIGARFGEEEAKEVERAARKSDQNKSQWLRDAALEQSKMPPCWIKSKWTREDLNLKEVEVRLEDSKFVLEGTGEFLAQRNPKGLLKIKVRVMTESNLSKTVFQVFWLTEYGADKIERNPNPEGPPFRLILA